MLNRLVTSLRTCGRGRGRLRALTVVIAVLCGCTARERVVFEEASPFQDVVVTETSEGVRTLRFGADGAVQSRALIGHPDRLLVPYVRSAMAGLAFVPSPERVLVVGLGGGSIVNFIALNYPEAQIDAVEIDPVVVEVARDWFEVTPSAQVRLLVDDGRRFIEQVALEVSELLAEPYDVIFLDAFGSSSIPEALTTQEFLVAVRGAVSAEGVVIANVWSGPQNPLYGSMATTYQSVFEEFYVFDVPRRANRIFALVAPTGALSTVDLTGKLARLSQRLAGDLDLAPLVVERDVRVTGKDFGGEVLRDPQSDRDIN